MQTDDYTIELLVVEGGGGDDSIPYYVRGYVNGMYMCGREVRYGKIRPIPMPEQDWLPDEVLNELSRQIDETAAMLLL